MFAAAGHGLAAAHAAGLTHRDFKPDNVMIRLDGRVVVLDFGLARGHAGPRESSTHSEPDLGRAGPEFAHTLTDAGSMPGSLLGTPHYMAPEQFRGELATASSDQFGFCVALWEAIYAERPFQASNLMELALVVSEGRLTEPARNDVPTWLRRVLERGLAGGPNQRWPTMLALLAALRADPTRRRRTRLAGVTVGVLAIVGVVGALVGHERQQSEAITACEREGQVILADWNPDVEATLAAAFKSSGLGFADSAWQHTQPRMADYASEWSAIRTQVCREARVDHTRGESAHAEIAECLAERQANFKTLAEAWREASYATITNAPTAAARLQPLSTCVDGSWAATRMAPPEVAREQVAGLRGRLERSAALQWIGAYPEAQRELELVEAEADELAWLPLSAEVQLRLSGVQSALGDYSLAEISGRRALHDGLASGYDFLVLTAAVQLTICAWQQAKAEPALLWDELAAGMITRLELESTVHAADRLNALGQTRLLQGQYAQALDLFRSGLAIYQTQLGPDHPHVATLLDSIGSVLDKLGDRQAALAHHQAALIISRASLGDDHPQVATSLNNIGSVQSNLEQYADGLVSYRQANAILVAAFGPEHPSIGTTLINAGTAELHLGRHEQAMATLQRGLGLIEKTLGPDHPNFALTLNNIGSVLADVGRSSEASEYYQRSVTALDHKLGPDHPDLAAPLNNLGSTQLRAAQPAAALTSYQRALVIRERTFGPENPALAYSLTGVGRAQLELGRIAEARVALERALVLRERAGITGELLSLTQFALARTRWAIGDHEAARTLAIAARDGYRAMAKPEQPELDEVETWLVEH